MSQDSPERIAADILIAMLSTGPSNHQANLAQPEATVDAYKKLFEAVHHARTKQQYD